MVTLAPLPEVQQQAGWRGPGSRRRYPRIEWPCTRTSRIL